MKKESKSDDYIVLRQNCNILREGFLSIGIKFEEGVFENGVWEVDSIGRTLHHLIPVGVNYRMNRPFGHPTESIVYTDEDGNERCEPFEVGPLYDDKEKAKEVLIEMLEDGGEITESELESIKSEEFEVTYQHNPNLVLKHSSLIEKNN